ncbi:hypothetical protein AX16_009474 [Volvariella volvacea WC 439]|nr:hypothetical protein AX16_009474 [Volvariella volvacea WC 439]
MFSKPRLDWENYYVCNDHLLTALIKRDSAFREMIEEARNTGSWTSFRRYPPLQIQQYTPLGLGYPQVVNLFEKFEGYRLTAKHPDYPRPLWLTVSFIRHAECESNRDYRKVEEPNNLTERGKLQASQLRDKWSNVRMDAIYSSDVVRTRETASTLLGSRSGHLTVQEHHDLVEQEHGPVVMNYFKSGDIEYADMERRGNIYAPYQSRREHRPTGGESANDVAERAQYRFLRIMFDRGVPLDQVPAESKEDFNRINTWGDVNHVPEGIPHIVMVSHNILLSELYESLHMWNDSCHKEMATEYRNAEWYDVPSISALT